MKKEKNRLKLGSYLKSFDSIKTWLISGDKVPKTHYKSMAIMFGLLLIGIPTFIVFILAVLEKFCNIIHKIYINLLIF